MEIDPDWQKLAVERITDSWLNSTVRANAQYQRGAPWRLSQKQLLIDSIFRGYPLPRFYFQKKVSKDVLGTSQVSLDVIDGQQRIMALAQFRQDKWPLFAISDDKIALPQSIRARDVPWAGKTFSALPEQLQKQFLELELLVVFIEEVEDDEVRDLFIRLQAGTPLTPQQVRDAWPGNIGPYIEMLAGKGDRQGQFSSLFQAIDRRGQGGRGEEENQDKFLDARQTCAQLLLLLLHRERGRTFPSLRSTALNGLYHEDTAFDTAGKTAVAFEQLLTDTAEVVRRRPINQGRKVTTKGRIFSLFLFLRLLRFSPVDVKRALPKVAQVFWNLEKDEEEPTGRVGDSNTLESHFKWFVMGPMSELDIPELDRKRAFDNRQKEEIYAAYEGNCGICQRPVSTFAVEYDHINPWILGGSTTVENGRPVHPQCHARGLAAVDGLETPSE